MQLWAARSRVELHDSLSFLGVVTSPVCSGLERVTAWLLPTVGYCTFPRGPPPPIHPLVMKSSCKSSLSIPLGGRLLL